MASWRPWSPSAHTQTPKRKNKTPTQLLCHPQRQYRNNRDYKKHKITGSKSVLCCGRICSKYYYIWEIYLSAFLLWIRWADALHFVITVYTKILFCESFLYTYIAHQGEGSLICCCSTLYFTLYEVGFLFKSKCFSNTIIIFQVLFCHNMTKSR